MTELQTRTILIVDDEEGIRAVLRASLEAGGFQVRTASNGMDALERIRSSPPDLIIHDVMLPDITGLDVCALVKRDRRLRRIPFVLLTARSQPQDRVTAAALGADAYHNKPVNADELLAEVRRLLAGREMADERA
jgi:two-component system, OmpR family, alkaline phosphatase synthesis response regulator PhoP